MAVQGTEDVYASLLLTDTYLPGALVLAHSLRDAGTTKKLAVLVTLDTVSADVVTQLKAVYDHVIPVSRIQNEHPANLDLMNRRDLHSAFTKINLWRQTQFRKIVYVDADIVAYRAPDELFNVPHPFSAAPDIGWPDLFNTGLMVLTPNMGDYYALTAMARRGISFDGADQGLLNMYFKNSFNRLSFSYNVTPSAHYQYVPAYKHFQSGINMVHFIGPEKPWLQGRDVTTGSSPFDQMVGRWWAVYDRHYRKETPRLEPSQPEQEVPAIVQYFVKGEFQPTIRYVVPVGEPPSDQPAQQYPHQSYPHPQQQPHQHSDDHHQHHYESQHQSHPHSQGAHTEVPKGQASEQWGSQPPVQAEHKPEPQPQPEMAPSWDAQRQPPPPGSMPEAMNFPQTHYTMSSDPAPFVLPARYPSPPKNMWYEVPKQAPAQPTEKPKPLFPWEAHRPPPTRVFAHLTQPQPPAPGPLPVSAREEQPGSQVQPEPSVTATQPGEPHTPPPPGPASRTALSAPTTTDIWSSFPRTNAWDNVPEINRYVDRRMQKHRRTRSDKNLALGGSGGAGAPGGGGGGGGGGVNDFATPRRGSKVTDFPSEDDRPSLPVTPAPIRRPRRWVAGGDGGGGGLGGLGGGDGGDEGEQLLQGAEGVPGQADWVCVHGNWWGPADCLCELANLLRCYKDPAAQLRKLAMEQSELLFRRLGAGEDGDGGAGGEGFGEEEEGGRAIPLRPLPFGSEGVKSPTYVAPAPPPQLVSPKPMKPTTGASPVNRILAAAPEILPEQEQEGTAGPIAAPSYQGPGPAFEKGEDIPTFETPALPTEEERDVLDT